MSQIGTSIRLLLVDDDSDLLDLTATYLEREDDRFAIETETNARDGLALLDEAQIDCIVSDYQMPDMNGLEFLDAVRTEYPDLPFLLFTGKGSEEIAAKAINAGVDGYLEKETGTGQYAVLAQHITTLVEKYCAERRLTNLEQQKHLADGGGVTITDGHDRSDTDPQYEAKSVCMKVVKAVAAREGVDPVTLTPPLYEAINPDALSSLFESQASEMDQRTGSVMFTYNGYTVTVSSDGEVVLDK